MATKYYPPWFSYGVFRFTRDQIIWAIDHSVSFERGKWPPEPSEYETDEYDKKNKEWFKRIVESSYVDVIGQSPLKPDAYFISPKTIWSEISKRLKATKKDGIILIGDIESRPQPSYESLKNSESRDALDYISLWDFKKRPPYYQFKKQGAYYQRKISTKR